MASAQASVGAAAACPTRGTIFNAAEPTLHGAATTPQPVVAPHTSTIIARADNRLNARLDPPDKPVICRFLTQFLS